MTQPTDLSLIVTALNGALFDESYPEQAQAGIDALGRFQERLAEMEALLADWPTMRALNAYGAEKATAKKVRAREIIAEMRR